MHVKTRAGSVIPLIILILLCAPINQSFAQNFPDVSGYWSGNITQERPEGTTNTPIQLLLVQESGIVNGNATLGTNAEPAVIFALQQTTAGLNTAFKETKIIGGNSQGGVNGGGWCFKSYTLSLSSTNPATLQGRWTAPGCAPGDIQLTRVVPINVDLSGAWIGNITQERPEGLQNLSMQLLITENGSGFGGLSTIESHAGANVTFSVRGVRTDTGGGFQELRIVNTNSPNGPGGVGWCTKLFVLNYSPVNNGVLQGRWTAADNCAPGAIQLVRAQSLSLPLIVR